MVIGGWGVQMFSLHGGGVKGVGGDRRGWEGGGVKGVGGG
jgi:hypothetical protein